MNSIRPSFTNGQHNRHCPKCQGSAARDWLADRQAELLLVPYHHVVFTLPAVIAKIAWHNKRQVYDLLFKASAMTHHPHIHMIVPGGETDPKRRFKEYSNGKSLF